MFSPANLPAQLHERIRVLGNESTPKGGEFVLYWMHHAVRARENPALNVAIHAGNALLLPVLVYQGLGGRHRFNSDRHHTFIMEGARDAAAELAQRGISYVFHLDRDPERQSPLQSLARRAALCIVEDFPAPPFPRWTRKLAQAAKVPVWAVDCCCVVPMRLLERAYARAFEFRRAADPLFKARVSAEWEEPVPEISHVTPDVGFAPSSLQRVDLAALCAQSSIDHTIGPVRHTPGGSHAGYRRWEAFKQRGLKTYHKLRNDAAIPRPRGVSGLSPYLHHGHVSPFRIAREAAQDRSEGAKKFVDELFVWRELAHNFCFHHDDPETIDSLPTWAKETLAARRKDPRPVTYSWEALARGRTGDPLWDAAQRSLFIHGELHNNVRMTWGKAFLEWTESPQEALRLMVDLNHRYALDGSDPNSYGGLLYCLGLFDRPFSPERAIRGTVRPRSIAQHARRMDLRTYQAKVSQPARTDRLRIAVVGAGLSGLFAARTLSDAGHTVTVLERARKAGGRAASRRHDNHAYDHGAQYFTLKDPRFRPYVESWVRDGVVSRWHARVSSLKAGRLKRPNSETVRYVGVPSMSALPRHLASSLDVLNECPVKALELLDGKWRLSTERALDSGTFDAVVLAVTPRQALPLLAQVPALAERVAKVDFTPCWSAMATFEQPLNLEFDAAFVEQSDLAWIARNASKPGRPLTESWVLHATAGWSEARLDEPPGVVAEALLAAFFQASGAAPSQAQHLQAHRWKYAQAIKPLTEGCIWSGDARLVVCGDWCHASRIEGACLSGMAAAGRILSLPDAAAANEIERAKS